MAAGIINVTTHAAFIPEIWAATTIDAYEATLVLANLIENWNPLFSGGGDTAFVPVFTNLASTDVQDIPDTIQALYSPQSAASSDLELLINQKKYASVEISNALQVFENQDLLAKYAGKLGYVLARYIDSAFAQAASGYSDHPAVDLTGLAVVTDTQLKDALNLAVRYLDEQDVPMEGRAFVFSPALYAKCRGADWFNSADFVVGRPIETGLVGDIFGVNVYRTSNLYAPTVSAVTTTHNLLIHKAAMAWADPKPITLKHAGTDGRWVHDQVTAETYYGYLSVPDDGTNNYGIVDIQTS